MKQEKQKIIAKQIGISEGYISRVLSGFRNLGAVKAKRVSDWLAQLVTHIPSRYEQTVRYYGFYSNKSRGLRKKADADDGIPAIIPSAMSSKEFRQNWARLIALKLHFVPESV